MSRFPTPAVPPPHPRRCPCCPPNLQSRFIKKMAAVRQLRNHNLSHSCTWFTSPASPHPAATPAAAPITPPPQSRFIKKMTAPRQQAGSGFCMMQLAWVGEAFVLIPADPTPPSIPEEPSSGLSGVAASSAPRAPGPVAQASAAVPAPSETKVWLKGTVLEYLEQRGASFLVSRRLHDLSIYPPDSVIDIDTLAYGLFLHEQHGANMLVQVCSEGERGGGVKS